MVLGGFEPDPEDWKGIDHGGMLVAIRDPGMRRRSRGAERSEVSRVAGGAKVGPSYSVSNSERRDTKPLARGCVVVELVSGCLSRRDVASGFRRHPELGRLGRHLMLIRKVVG